MQCMSHHKHMNKQERNFLLFYWEHNVSPAKTSLSVLLAVVSVGRVSSSAPLALEVEGLQEAVELDSEVELLQPEHTAIVQLFIETRVTWLMRTTPT